MTLDNQKPMSERLMKSRERGRLRWQYYGLVGRLRHCESTFMAIQEHPLVTEEAKMQAHFALQHIRGCLREMATRVDQTPKTTKI
jgi:hypothetical protein